MSEAGLSAWVARLGPGRRRERVLQATSSADLDRLAAALGEDFTADLRPTSYHLTRLRRGLPAAIPPGLGPGRPVGAPQPPAGPALLSLCEATPWPGSLAELAARVRHANPTDTDASWLRDLWQDLLLHEVDLRLQILYRAFLAARGIEPGGTADGAADLVDRLRPTRPLVEDLLDRVDLPGLARWLGLPTEGGRRALRGRLQNLAFPVRRLALRFTYHCNLCCRHCYNGSGPHRARETLSTETMLRAVREMPAAGIEALHLTGGEPFLYLGVLTRLIEAARDSGLAAVSVNTNGFWARDTGGAEDALERLARAGFGSGQDWLKVSAGVFHQEAGIGLGTVACLARAFHRRFGRPVVVDYEAAEGEAARPELLGSLAGHGLEADTVDLRLRCVAEAGRGALAGEALRPRPAGVFGACRRVGILAVDPDGRCRPCCGLNADNDGIVVGSLHAHTLREVVKRMQNDPLLQLVDREPMAALLDRLGRGRDLRACHICSLCQVAVGKATEAELLALRRGQLPATRFYPHWLLDEAAPGPAG